MILKLTIELPISLSREARAQEVWALATAFLDTLPQIVAKKASDDDTEPRYSYYASVTLDGAKPITRAQWDYLTTHPGYCLEIMAPRKEPVTGQLAAVGEVEEEPV